jgi:hypothetical protein
MIDRTLHKQNRALRFISKLRLHCACVQRSYSFEAVAAIRSAFFCTTRCEKLVNTTRMQINTQIGGKHMNKQLDRAKCVLVTVNGTGFHLQNCVCGVVFGKRAHVAQPCGNVRILGEVFLNDRQLQNACHTRKATNAQQH